MVGTGFRVVKSTYIGYVGALYLFLALPASVAINTLLFGQFDAEREARKPALRILVELCLHIWLLGVIIYIARNLVELIPMPFIDNAFGFERRRVKELATAPVFVYVLLKHQRYLADKMDHVHNKIASALKRHN
jgi:hypothetical protein